MIAALITTLTFTSATLPIRVEGDGFLRLAKDGRLTYATSATLAAVNGALGTSEGQLLLPRLSLGGEPKSIEVDLQGNVSVSGRQIGRIVLAAFPNGKVTKGIVPKLVNPGEGPFGVIRSESPTPAPVVPKPNSPTTVAGKVTVTVRPENQVNSDQFTIGDIALIDGDPALVEQIAAISMGASPMLGTNRGLALVHLLSRIRMAGIDDKQVSLTVPEGATVSRPAQTIAFAAMVEAASEAIRTKLGVSGPFTPIKAQGGLTLPTGDYQLTAELGTVSSSAINVTVTAMLGGKTVATRVIAMAPATPLPSVKVGDTVMVRLVTAGLSVDCEGRVITAGVVGQTVSVSVSIYPGRPKTLTAVVKDANRVEVSS